MKINLPKGFVILSRRNDANLPVAAFVSMKGNKRPVWTPDIGKAKVWASYQDAYDYNQLVSSYANATAVYDYPIAKAILEKKGDMDEVRKIISWGARAGKNPDSNGTYNSYRGKPKKQAQAEEPEHIDGEMPEFSDTSGVEIDLTEGIL